MADISWLIIVGLGVIGYMAAKGRISMPMGGHGRTDKHIRQEFGFLKAIKPAMFETPDGFARPEGYRHNNYGGLDIQLTDGRIIPNVSADSDIPSLSGKQVLDLMIGNLTVPLPVCIDTGERVTWAAFHAPHGSDHNQLLKDGWDKADERYQNLKNMGLNVGDGMAYYKELNNITKTMGEIGRNLGVRDRPMAPEVSIRRNPFMDEQGMEAGL